MKVYLIEFDGSNVLYKKKVHGKKVFRFIYWKKTDICLVCGKNIHTCDDLYKIVVKNGFPEVPYDISGSMECGILSTFVINRDSPVVKTLSKSKKLLLGVLGLESWDKKSK